MSAEPPTPATALERGWSIIPTGLDKRPYFDLLPKKSDGKGTWKPFQTRPPSADELQTWLQANSPGFAIVTGAISQMVTFDFDGETGRKLAGTWGIRPHRRTGSGGLHWDVMHPGHYIPTLNGKAKEELGRRWPGLDVKGDGGYAVAFGRNASGKYEWLRDPEPDESGLVPAEVWEFLRACRNVKPETPKDVSHQNGNRQMANRSPADTRVDHERLIRMALDQVPSTGRNNSGLWLACQLRDNGYSIAEAQAPMRNYRSTVPGTNTKGEREPYTEQEMQASLREAYSRPAREPWAQRATGPSGRPVIAPLPDQIAPQLAEPPEDFAASPDGPGSEPSECTRYRWNDTGNANRLADLHGHELIYCRERRSYYVWTGQRWQFDDESLRAEKLAEKTMLEAFAEAGKITDKDARAAFLKFVNRSLSRSGLANMVHLTKKKAQQVSANDFDADQCLLNTLTGTVNLQTGALRSHRSEDLLSKLIPLHYEKRAKCPLFMKFIYRIMGRHPGASESEKRNAELMVRYLQKAFGCAATGIPEKILFVLYGVGNNGKTTLLEIIRDALGDREYAGQMQVDSLMIRPKEALSSNAVNTDLADLQGCRFVSSSEVEQGQRLSLSRVKYLTGMGQIKARRMRENMITFKPTHKTFLDCNHRPVITDPNDAIWNRVKCIPFKVQIPDDEIDTDLPRRLRTELPGILRWIVEGAVLYRKEGLGDPPGVQVATEEYRQQSDRLREFLEDRCVINLSEKKCCVPIANLYPTYLAWAEAVGDKYPLSKQVFEERLERRGCSKGQDSSGSTRVWKGIRFRIDSDKI